MSGPAAPGWNFTAIRQLFPARIETQALLFGVFSARVRDVI
jgi:hypothetical protein